MNIVIFLNAAHQRKYVDVLSSAMAGLEDARVQAVDISTDGAKQSAAKKSFRAKLKKFRPFRLATKFIGAVFYIPYAGFMKLLELYRRYVHKHLLQTARSAVRRAQKQSLYSRLHTIASGFFQYLPRMKARVFRSLRLLLSPARAAVAYLWRHGFRPALLFFYKHLAGVQNYFGRQSILYVLLSERHWQRYLENRLFSLQPDLIVLLEDNAEGLTGLVSHAARERKVPYVILPDFIPNPAEPARYYFNNPLHSADTLPGRLVRFFAPRWILEYDGKQLLRLPGSAIAVRWMRRQHCPQPWILNAGYTDAILLESKASLKHYEHLGFKPEKLRVIGGAVEDGLHAIHLDKDQRRKALDARYKLDPTKPLVVCGFPPDQYTAATEGFEFKTYEDLCRSWFAALAEVSGRANVLVVRHPRMKPSELTPYAIAGVQIATEKLETILPVADLYVACISTTIRWALALGIPVINYDTYRYSYGDFSSALGCLEVTSVDAFRSTMGKMLLPGGLDEIRITAARDAIEWGLMDGMFKERLRDTLIDVCQTYKGSPTQTHAHDYCLTLPA